METPTRLPLPPFALVGVRCTAQPETGVFIRGTERQHHQAEIETAYSAGDTSIPASAKQCVHDPTSAPENTELTKIRKEISDNDNLAPVEMSNCQIKDMRCSPVTTDSIQQQGLVRLKTGNMTTAARDSEPSMQLRRHASSARAARTGHLTAADSDEASTPRELAPGTEVHRATVQTTQPSLMQWLRPVPATVTYGGDSAAARFPDNTDTDVTEPEQTEASSPEDNPEAADREASTTCPQSSRPGGSASPATA